MTTVNSHENLRWVIRRNAKLGPIIAQLDGRFLRLWTWRGRLLRVYFYAEPYNAKRAYVRSLAAGALPDR